MTPTHCTVIIGWDKEGVIRWMRTYDYANQREEAQRHLDELIAAGMAWKISAIELIKLKEEEEIEED